MPTAKFKSFEQAAEALVLHPRTASVATRMRALFELSARISPVRCSSGVKKYRSLEEAGEARCDVLRRIDSRSRDRIG
jgi:hypothetical protein